MELERFDRIAAALGGAATRRSGLRAAMALLLGIGGGAAGGAAGARRHERRESGPEHQGGPTERERVNEEKRPCGPTARDNRCRKHSDCCTKYCRRPKKGSAKVGRCRCIKPGKRCKPGQTCCGRGRCKNKRCTLPKPPEPACGATGAACASDASCCNGLICTNGACGACVEVVCAIGCQYTSVNDAYAAMPAGSTIIIGAGTYPTGVTVTKDMTLAACPGVTGVILQPDRVLQTSESTYAIFSEDPADAVTVRTLTLRGLGLKGTPDGFTNQDEMLLFSNANGTVAWTLDECDISDAYAVLWSVGQTSTFTDTDITGCSYGAYISADTASLSITGGTLTGLDNYLIYMSISNGALTITDATIVPGSYYPIYFSGNGASGRSDTTATLTNTTITGGTYAPPNFYNGVVTIVGCTISGIQSTTLGGGLYLEDTVATVTDTTITSNAEVGIYYSSFLIDASLTVDGTTAITANGTTAAIGAGGIEWNSYGGKGAISVANTTTISGNSGYQGAQCAKKFNNNNWTAMNCLTWT